MFYDTTINELTFHVVAIVDILTIAIFLIVSSLFIRITSNGDKEDKEPTTKLGKWMENTKVIKWMNKHEQTLVKITEIAVCVVTLFAIYFCLISGTKMLLRYTQGATTDIEIVTSLNLAFISGGLLALMPFLDKIRLFKRREKNRETSTEELSN
ncbi:hypothetical protein [Lysinibacillus fusiformis]|uniref:hypothetical protein n=1 Tax=Lysinibacillus fusiformis TaxID=28031 RepID=UPI003D063A69